MDIKTLEDEALRLGPEARATLAQKLLLSLESLSVAETEEAWLDEAERFLRCGQARLDRRGHEQHGQGDPDPPAGRHALARQASPGG